MKLSSDIKANKRNTKGLFFILFFRFSSFFSKNIFLKILGLPVRLLYKITVQWILGIDIPDTTTIGQGFLLFHGQGLIVNSATVIGENVTMRHNTTVGNAFPLGGSPVIEDYVEIGASAVVIGEITVGKNALIAAGSVVTKDVAPNTIVAGNPAKVIRSR